MAVASTWPVPNVEAAMASRSASGTRESPDADAISTTARSPARRKAAVSVRINGSLAATWWRSQPPLASTASSVPSPPSAIGVSEISSCGRTADQPAARASATTTDENVPLKESGATRTRSARSATLALGQSALAAVLGDAVHRRPLHVGQVEDVQ